MKPLKRERGRGADGVPKRAEARGEGDHPAQSRQDEEGGNEEEEQRDLARDSSLRARALRGLDVR